MDLSKLTNTIGYTFREQSLLQAALTHRSMQQDNNERLEFLGDALLNFIIAEYIFRQFPQAQEGEMSRLRAKLVRGETLAEIAVRFSLGDFLLLSIGEFKMGGARRHSILADAVEALIGAIYLDSDFKITEQVVLKWYADQLKTLELNTILKDPKSLLQELLQASKLPLPTYAIVKTTGKAHVQTFHVQCQVEGLSYSTQAAGTTRRNAEQAAAQKFLHKLQGKKMHE